jgi:hypothetical protein
MEPGAPASIVDPAAESAVIELLTSTDESTD